MSLTIRDVHIPGGMVRPRRRRHVLFLKASFFSRGDVNVSPLSQAEHQQRINAARRSAEVRRRMGAAAGKGGRAALIAAIGAGAIGSLAAPVRERRAPGITEGQERVSRLAGYVGAGVGGLAGGLLGGGFGSAALGLAGSVAGQELFERGTLALFGRDRGDMARRFTEGNRIDTPGASLGGGIGAIGGHAASYLLNRTTPGRALRGARDVLMPAAGGALGAEVGRHFEGRGLKLPEAALGLGGLAGLSMLGRSVGGLNGRRSTYRALPPVLSNRSLLRYARLSKSVTEAEREQRRNAARARWANHTPDNIQDTEDRSVSRRARDTAISVGIGAAALGLGVGLIGLLARRRGPRGGMAMRLLAARAARSEAKATVGRMTDLNRRIGLMEAKLATGEMQKPGVGLKQHRIKQSQLKSFMTRLTRLQGERSNLEGRAGRARELLATTFRAKLTSSGLKRTANNAKFRKFNDPLSSEEIEQRRAAGRASAAARRARAHATEVIEPTPKVNEAISPGFFTRDNLIIGALGGAALGGLFALARGKIKAREAARTAELSTNALRRVMPQMVEEMRAGVRGAERLASDAGLFRLMARGVSQHGDDLAAAGQRAERAIELAEEARRRAGNNLVNLSPSQSGASRTGDMRASFTGRMQLTTGTRSQVLERDANKLLGLSSGSGQRQTHEAPDLFSGGTTGSLGADADYANRLRQVAGWARTAIGREQGARELQGPGKSLTGPGQPGLTSGGLNRLADAADSVGNRLSAGVEGARLTLKPINSRRVANVGQPDISLRRLNDSIFVEPSERRLIMGHSRRDRLAAQAIDDITDAEAERLLASRAESLRWLRNERKMKAMRGKTAFSEWGQVQGNGVVERRAVTPYRPSERTIGGSFRGSGADSSLYITPSPASQYRFGGALSDPTSPFRRGRFSRS